MTTPSHGYISEQTWEAMDYPMPTATAAEIENEPMFYNANYDLLVKHMDGLTGHFLRRVRAFYPERFENKNWSMDSRSHMLMPGWYPAIPGWHHDDWDRGADGQPDYTLAMPNDRVIIVSVVDAIDKPTGSLTEFLDHRSVWLPPVEPGKVIYRAWDDYLTARGLRAVEVESGKLYVFGTDDLHRAMPAKTTGWRWFARFTFNPGPRPDGPKIRRQSQVYLPVINQGW